MSKKNYKATKEFLLGVRNCEYTGRQLFEMMENRFKAYAQAGYPKKLIEMTKLQAKMGEDKYGNNLFAAVFTEIPIHVNTRWMNNSILAHNDKEWESSHWFLTRLFPEIEPMDYKAVHDLFDDFCRTMNEPIIVCA